MIAPNTNIRLLKTPMELNDANTLSFASETDKYNYFNSLPKLSLDGATYQRKEGVLRYPTTSSDTFEDLLQYNYCMYQNASYDTKWFYAYIDDIKYINDGMTEIKLRTDTFMTWQNDIVYKQSFIERQHVSDDTVGLHTVPENLETGDYIVASSVADSSLTDLCIVCATSVYSELSGDYAHGQLVNGIYTGLVYVGFDTTTDGISALNTFISSLNAKPEAIISIFMYPKALIPGGWTSGLISKILTTDRSTGVNTYDITLTPPSTIDGYTPKNNKLKIWPYRYLAVSNNAGTTNIMQYEYFGSSVKFTVEGVVCPGGSIRCFPKNYKGISNNQQEVLSCGKFPTCAWTNDSFINWMTSNAVNLGMGVVGDIANIITGNYVGAVGGIASQVSQIYKHSLVPPTVKGNTNTGDVTTSSGDNTFIFYNMNIKSEMARVIDNYFTMYGYKVNSLETINIHKRTYFDYIKTIGCNIIGNIPQKDLEEIRNLFDNGLTIWHNPSYFLDYSVNNAIIS